MTAEEEAKMLNEDHEIWSSVKFDAHRIDLSKIDHIDEQLYSLIDYFHKSGIHEHKYTPFCMTAPLYIDKLKSIPMVFEDAEIAEEVVRQMNARLTDCRLRAINALIETSHSKEEIDSKIDGLFSVRCVDMPIPKFGDKIYHCIGLIVSHYNSELKLTKKELFNENISHY